MRCLEAVCPSCGKRIEENLALQMSDKSGNFWPEASSVVECLECGAALEVAVLEAVAFDVQLIQEPA